MLGTEGVAGVVGLGTEGVAGVVGVEVPGVEGVVDGVVGVDGDVAGPPAAA